MPEHFLALVTSEVDESSKSVGPPAFHAQCVEKQVQVARHLNSSSNISGDSRPSQSAISTIPSGFSLEHLFSADLDGPT